MENERNEKIRGLLRSVTGEKVDFEQEDEGCIEDSRVSNYALSNRDGLAETITFVICGNKPNITDQDLSKREVNAVEYVWDNREDIFNDVNGILNSFSNKDRPFNLFRYVLRTIPKLNYSKAGLITQMLMGYLGCFDCEESPQFDGMDVSSKAYNNFMQMMQKNAGNEKVKDIWKNWLNLISNTNIQETTGNKKATIELRAFNNNPDIGRKRFWTVHNG